MNKQGQNIPDGYKQTEVGIIPKDWEVKKLSNQVHIDKTNIKSDYDKEFINYVSLSDVENGSAHYNRIKFQEAPSRAKRIAPKHSVLFATVRPNLKNFALVEDDEVVASTGFAVLEKKKADIKFIYNYLHSYQAERQYNALTVGSNYPALNSTDVKNLKIPIPPLPEQKEIANCLTAWDTAIEKLTLLIDLKKRAKKGLMQQLLTGKKRLPGFTENWKEVKLGDIGEFKTSSVNKKIENDKQIVSLVNYMDVYRNTHINSSIKFSKTSVKKSQLISSKLTIGDILFTPSSETPDDIGHSAVVEEDMENVVFSYHLIRFRPIEMILDLTFSGYVFNIVEILDEFSRRATGSTRFTLSIKDFKEVNTIIPPLEEQTAIAKILQTADKEIELLEEKLKATKQQKKGLMQVLLTGKKRLI